MINKDGGEIFRFYGGHSCYEGGRHRAHGGPPTGKTLGVFLKDLKSLSKFLYFDTGISSLHLTSS